MKISDWTDGVDDDAWVYSPWELLPGVRTGDELTRGEKAADAVRNKMGSWAFVSLFMVFMFIWAGVNVFWLGNKAFDPYPFILLNLFLSMLAGLQGAILLIAAKRADAVAAEQALSHLTISKSSREIINELKIELKKNSEMTRELKALTTEVKKLIELEGGH
jgi:uncharacterized membrane protein